MGKTVTSSGCGRLRRHQGCRSDEDLPSVKQSNGARNKLRRGWFCEAYMKKNLPWSTKAYYMQCTTWKDKKQVMYLATNWVGFSQGLSSSMWKEKKCETILQPQAHAAYVWSMNGVDQNDQDSRDYSTSIHTNWWYLRIFWWALDQVVHVQHSLVTFLAEQGIEKPEWKKDRDKNEGRHNFQIDLGISLLNYGIGLDWDGVSGERPSYMQSGAFKPCDCKKCFFCLKGHTHRITHRPQKPNNCGTQVRTNECTNECVNLGKSSGTFYQMCYRKQLTTELIANKRKKTCRTSRLGCVICKEPICTKYWKEGYDKHA